MNTLKNNTLHYINDSNFVLCNSNVDKLINYYNSNLSIIYFTYNLNNSNSTKLLLNNSFVDRILKQKINFLFEDYCLYIKFSNT